jgi:Putative serine esterase (DUF676)
MTLKRVILGVGGTLIVGLMVLTILGTRAGERPNALMPTLGGMQLWNDEVLKGGWRVQRHIATGHCRLLDAGDVRRAWGEGQDCTQAMAVRGLSGDIAENPKKITILVHGLGGFGWTFRDMKPALVTAGLNAEHWNYASTRGSLDDHVASFHAMMNQLGQVNEVSFVAHSLGGLLLRKALADSSQPWRSRIRVTGLVMIGTPNQGAALADRFKDESWFLIGLDQAGQDLTSGYAAGIPLPVVPYFLVAGKLEGEGNSLIPGADDGMVAVAEVRLNPDDKMLVVEGNHAAITADPAVIRFVLQSLATLP